MEQQHTTTATPPPTPSPAAARGAWEISSGMSRWAGITSNTTAAIREGLARSRRDDYAESARTIDLYLTDAGRAFALARGWL